MMSVDQAIWRMSDTESNEVIVVREWDTDAFHRRVAELEAEGYIFREESYRIIAEMNPESGEITHLHIIEMSKNVS